MPNLCVVPQPACPAGFRKFLCQPCHHALRSHARPSALVCESDLHRSHRSFRTDSLATPVPTLSSLRTRMPSWGPNDITPAHCTVMSCPPSQTCTPRGHMRIVWVRSVLGRWVRCKRHPLHPPSLPSPPTPGKPPLCSVGKPTSAQSKLIVYEVYSVYLSTGRRARFGLYIK